MRLVNFVLHEDPQKLHWGLVLGETVVDVLAAQSWAQGALGLAAEPLPGSLMDLIHNPAETIRYLNTLTEGLVGQELTHLKGSHRSRVGYDFREVYLYPPVLRPPSLRDFYAFETHVKAANTIRGREIPEEWYRFPVFYFSNPNAIYGPQLTIIPPSDCQELDFELEIACVIGKMGRNIPAKEAEQYIFGYMVFNDWSARDIQREEMRVGLGPAKAKDFASSLGPFLVTPDELADRSTDRPGVYDLVMTARVNGQERSRGNWKDLYYSFGDMIERASRDVYLFPGDVIGSGTVGTGCLLEVTAGKGPWLKAGDIVDLEIERLGVLSNRVGEPARVKAGEQPVN